KHLPSMVEQAFGLALAQGDLGAAEGLKEELSRETSYTNRGIRHTLRLRYYYLGRLALKRGRAAEAVGWFKQALSQAPFFWNVGGVEGCLGDAYGDLGRLDEAITEYTRVLSLNPNHALARYPLARTYERRAEVAKARAEYRRFLEIWKDADGDIPELM